MLDDGLKTKGRVLLANAGLDPEPLFEGPDRSLSADSPSTPRRGEIFSTPDGKGSPAQAAGRPTPRYYNMATPGSPTAEHGVPRSPNGNRGEREQDWDDRSNAGSQSSEQAALLAVIREQNELMAKNSAAQLALQQEELALRKREL